jgi:hypothetical protein
MPSETSKMDYFKNAVNGIEWNKVPIFGAITNSPKMKSILDFYYIKNNYAAKNRRMWEVALDQLRYEERATRRRNEARKAQ